MNAHADPDAATCDRFRAFVDEYVRPYAAQFDADERIPPPVIDRIAAAGYLGYALPAEWGGGGNGLVSWGLLNEHIGRGCSSLRSLLTVHAMVAHTLVKWGTDWQRSHWLARLATGQTIAAFALSEPNSGSDAGAMATTARQVDDGYVLDGIKSWISFGQIAGVFLVFARCEGRPGAFLVERDSAGLEVVPVKGLLGLRGSMVADLHLTSCLIPRAALVGALGFGLSHVAGWALDLGRYSVAWGSVGIAQACLDASTRYASQRQQSGALLKDHQLIRRMLTEMIVNVQAARLLCLDAGRLKEARDPRAVLQTSIAKYFSARAAARSARDAVQIHGANGCSADYPVARHFRDAKIMQIIEGSDEIQQLAIAEHGGDWQ